jgi:glucosylglycerate phosphorylase
MYGESQGEEAFARLSRVIAAYPSIKPRLGDDLTERDVLLITYGDQVQDPDQPPLQTLNCFCARYLTGVVSAIHLLPFHPSTSDDGFAVADYRAVNPGWGSWDDIAQLGARFRLMFDAVVNHVSSQHPWFQAYLRGEPPYTDYFITVEGEPDLSQVVRPRALPLLTRASRPRWAGERCGPPSAPTR